MLTSNGAGGFAWADDEDTTYTADESTLTLSGGEFSVMDSGVTATQLGLGAVTAVKLSGAGGEWDVWSGLDVQRKRRIRLGR